MGAAERKKRVQSFADVAGRVSPPSSDVQELNQLRFEGLGTAEKEVTIENLQVMKLPQVKKVHDSIEWSCSVSYQPDLWHQEDYGYLMLHALHNADAAIALRLKAGDLLHVRGVPWVQRLELRGGKINIMHHLNVTDMIVMKRAPTRQRR